MKINKLIGKYQSMVESKAKECVEECKEEIIREEYFFIDEDSYIALDCLGDCISEVVEKIINEFEPVNLIHIFAENLAEDEWYFLEEALSENIKSIIWDDLCEAIKPLLAQLKIEVEDEKKKMAEFQGKKEEESQCQKTQ